MRDTKNTIFLTNADLVSGLDLDAVLAMHRERDADLTIVTHDERQQLPRGEVLCDFAGNVLAYHEKPTKVFRMSSGMYLMEPGVLDLLAPNETVHLSGLVARIIDSDLSVFEFPHDDPWVDVNEPADLERARALVDEDPTVFGLPPRA